MHLDASYVLQHIAEDDPEDNPVIMPLVQDKPSLLEPRLIGFAISASVADSCYSAVFMAVTSHSRQIGLPGR